MYIEELKKKLTELQDNNQISNEDYELVSKWLGILNDELSEGEESVNTSK